MTGDPTPWVSPTGFRTAVQAWHPVHGLSEFAPRNPSSFQQDVAKDMLDPEYRAAFDAEAERIRESAAKDA